MHLTGMHFAYYRCKFLKTSRMSWAGAVVMVAWIYPAFWVLRLSKRTFADTVQYRCESTNTLSSIQILLSSKRWASKKRIEFAIDIWDYCSWTALCQKNTDAESRVFPKSNGSYNQCIEITHLWTTALTVLHIILSGCPVSAFAWNWSAVEHHAPNHFCCGSRTL